MPDERDITERIVADRSGPIPEDVLRAASRRRVAIRTRRLAASAGCLAVAGGVVGWVALTQPRQLQPTVVAQPLVEPGPESDSIDPVRFAAASVLGLRRGGLADLWEAPRGPTRQIDQPTVFGLRQSELGGLDAPAS